jgi:hypothetical protein
MNSSTSEVISMIPISCDEDHVSIDAGTLASGTYSYTLNLDGRIIAEKQMEIQKYILQLTIGNFCRTLI